MRRSESSSGATDLPSGPGYINDVYTDEPDSRIGCAAQALLGVIVGLLILYFITHNEKPVDIAVLPMVEISVSPVWIILVSMILGAVLTLLAQMGRRRYIQRKAAREGESEEER